MVSEGLAFGKFRSCIHSRNFFQAFYLRKCSDPLTDTEPLAANPQVIGGARVGARDGCIRGCSRDVRTWCARGRRWPAAPWARGSVAEADWNLTGGLTV